MHVLFTYWRGAVSVVSPFHRLSSCVEAQFYACALHETAVWMDHEIQIIKEVALRGTVEDGLKNDFVPRVTLGTIFNQQNLELL